jgi:arylsulfatase A-like enzyme
VALGLCLLVLSFSRLVGDAQSGAVRGATFDAAFTGPLWGSILGNNLVLFAGALLALHAGYGVFCWLLARVSHVVWRSETARLGHHVLLWFLLMTLAVLAGNAGRVPQSSLGEPYYALARTQILGTSLWVWIALVVTAGILVTLGAGVRHWLRATPRARKPAAIAVALGAVIATTAAVTPHEPPKAAPSARPNVILIGIDSLRPDLLYPKTSRELMPNLYAFADGATLFTNAITPLARTFPSMTTILSGRHPHTTGAVMNLSPRQAIHEGDTLGRVLGRAGYATTYATDEVRFSNIDASYGFQKAITPPIGVSEIVISFAADTPLSNLVVNTWLGELLFPHVHANRGATHTYDPDRFLHRLEREVEFHQPLFLTAHLTLSHWPYTWMDTPSVDTRKSGDAYKASVEKWPKYYLEVAERVDRQFGDLLALLERRGVLENALVIVYSDHGESFGFTSELLSPDTSDARAQGERDKWGHGSSVLIPDQYRVVLAMRAFGSSRLLPAGERTVDAPVAVQDIAPTITDLLGLQSRDAYDGRSLVGLLRNEPAATLAFSDRVRFTETEFTPRNIVTPSGGISASAFEEARKFYNLNRRTDRLELKQRRLATLLSDRQYAALGRNFLLAALPSPDRPFEYVVIDLHARKLQQLTGPPAADAPAELTTLWQALQSEFGKLLAPRAAGAVSPPGPVSHGQG